VTLHYLTSDLREWQTRYICTKRAVGETQCPSVQDLCRPKMSTLYLDRWSRGNKQKFIIFGKSNPNVSVIRFV